MSCLTQHKTKEELIDWVIDNVGDGNPYYDLNLLAEEIWDMMNAESPYQKKLEEENKKLQEQLNEESEQRLKNKECWMSVQKQYHELKEENKKLTEYAEEQREIMSKVIDGMKQEILKLQEEVNDRVVIEDIADAFGSEEGEDFDWESEIHELQEENNQAEGLLLWRSARIKELQAENKKLIAGIDDAVEDHFADLKLRETTHKEWDTLEEENKKLKKEIDDYWRVDDEIGGFVDGKFSDIASHLRECWEDRESKRKLYSDRNKQRNKLVEENKELEMKGNARKDIIKNMFECITADLEEVEDGGFYIKRDWGHKYIDTWNEIVTQEYKDALKEINEQLEGIEWETDGYQFDLNIVDESESEEESDEEEDPDCCESCGKKFDLAYTMNHCEPELKEKYDKYMGSPEDDGDMCPICMDSDDPDEEEKCEECGKCLEGEDKCGEGCPSYDKGWNETHEEEE